MKGKKGFILLAVVLALALVGGGVAYRALSVRYQPDTAAAADEATLRAAADGEAGGAEYAADFTVYDGDGNAARLADYIGKPVIINFWATWCPSCRAELPDFEAAYQAYGDRVQFLMVDLTDGYQETQADAEAFVAENGYTFPLFFDTAGSAVRAYGVSAIPVTVAVNPDGTVYSRQIGGMAHNSLQTLIDALLDA